MTESDPHAAHGDLTLSLTSATPDGGRVHQSWTVCDCTMPRFRAMLGAPEHESYSTAEQVAATAAAALRLGGPQLG